MMELSSSDYFESFYVFFIIARLEPFGPHFVSMFQSRRMISFTSANLNLVITISRLRYK